MQDQLQFKEDPNVELEDMGVPMKHPFDPNSIKVRPQTITIDALIERLRHEEIDLSTKFQRKEGLWDDDQQSRLIESIIIRFPLPVFYFDGSNPNKWLVIDGLQRLSSLKRFILTKELKLSGLEFLKLEGYGWDDLNRPDQRQIKETQLQCYVLEEGTEENVKFNMFKRINTGGLILSTQEIRHAMHQGVAANFIQELADLPDFKNATNNKINTERMLDRDFVNRFIAFYLLNYESDYTYTDDLDLFMNRALTKLSASTEDSRNLMRYNFIQALRLSHEIFGEATFCKAENYKRINKALFEVMTVSFAKLSDEERLLIGNKKDVFKNLFYQRMHENKFKDSLASNTGGKSNITLRYTEFNNIIQEIININD